MNAFSNLNTFLFGEDIHYGGGRYGPITQSCLEFILVQDGAAEVEIDGHRHPLIEGYALLVLSQNYLCFDYQTGIDTRVLWCEATLPSSTEELGFLFSAHPMILSVSPRMLELQRMGMDLEPSFGEEDELLRATLGRALFQEFLYQEHRSTRDRPIHRSVLRAKDYIERNTSIPCSLTEIATYSNVTPQHLIRIFKRDMGQTPVHYLWALRAKKGAQMLRRSGLSVAEIAYRCGYENAAHFSRHIKEHFGTPPTELRRRRWQKQDNQGS